MLLCRFMSASVEHNIQTYILELVHDQLTRRQTLDSVTRNLLKLLTVTCGYSQIRLLVSQRLEMWLTNPKVNFVCSVANPGGGGGEIIILVPLRVL